MLGTKQKGFRSLYELAKENRSRNNKCDFALRSSKAKVKAYAPAALLPKK
jgi:hypothetical protein